MPHGGSISTSRLNRRPDPLWRLKFEEEALMGEGFFFIV
jgi:hypothetical protein